MGDVGTEVFFDVQKTVLQTLEDKYYSPFLSSQQYQDLKNELTAEDLTDISLGSFSVCSDEQNSSSSDLDATIDVQNHSTYAKIKLDQIQV